LNGVDPLAWRRGRVLPGRLGQRSQLSEEVIQFPDRVAIHAPGPVVGPVQGAPESRVIQEYLHGVHLVTLLDPRVVDQLGGCLEEEEAAQVVLDRRIAPEPVREGGERGVDLLHVLLPLADLPACALGRARLLRRGDRILGHGDAPSQRPLEIVLRRWTEAHGAGHDDDQFGEGHGSMVGAGRTLRNGITFLSASRLRPTVATPAFSCPASRPRGFRRRTRRRRGAPGPSPPPAGT
jgi:hypothetical protein